jgi:hypothetical protein
MRTVTRWSRTNSCDDPVRADLRNSQAHDPGRPAVTQGVGGVPADQSLEPAAPATWHLQDPYSAQAIQTVIAKLMYPTSRSTIFAK